VYDRYGNITGAEADMRVPGTNRATGAGEVDDKLKGRGMMGPTPSNQVSGVTGSRGRPSTESAAPTASIRGMFTPGAGSTNGLSLRAEGSLFDSQIFSANRAIEKGFDKPVAPRTAQPNAGVSGVSASVARETSFSSGAKLSTGTDPLNTKLTSRVAAPDSLVSENDPYAMGANANSLLSKPLDTGLSDSNRFSDQSAMYGGDVADPMEFLSMALRDGLGDEKLIQAAMKGGDSYGRKYKNLNRMGVL